MHCDKRQRAESQGKPARLRKLGVVDAKS